MSEEHATIIVYFTDHKGADQQRAERIAAAEVDAHLEQMMKRGFVFKGTHNALEVVPPHKILGCRISFSGGKEE